MNTKNAMIPAAFFVFFVDFFVANRLTPAIMSIDDDCCVHPLL
jgi:hypothetical protein